MYHDYSPAYNSDPQRGEHGDLPYRVGWTPGAQSRVYTLDVASGSQHHAQPTPHATFQPDHLQTLHTLAEWQLQADFQADNPKPEKKVFANRDDFQEFVSMAAGKQKKFDPSAVFRTLVTEMNQVTFTENETAPEKQIVCQLNKCGQGYDLSIDPPGRHAKPKSSERLGGWPISDFNTGPKSVDTIR